MSGNEQAELPVNVDPNKSEERLQVINAVHYRQFKVSKKGIDKATYTLEDINYSNDSSKDSSATSSNRRTTVPKLMVWEYQPDVFFNWRQKLKKLELAFKGGWTNFAKGISLVWNVAESKIRNKARDAAKTDWQSSYSNMGKDYNKNVLETPIRMYKEFFEGKYLNRFEMPFTGDSYLEADGYKGWSVKDENAKTAFDFVNNLQAFIKNIIPMDVPIIPEWQTDNKYLSYETEFYLYNNTFDNLRNNFHYINALVTGAHWIQVEYRHYSSNVYTVTLPGISNMLYAGMQINVTQMGNRRKLPSDLRTKLETEAVILSEHTMLPDAWKLKITFTSLVPNNYNTFIYGLMTNEGNIGGDIKSINGQVKVTGDKAVKIGQARIRTDEQEKADDERINKIRQDQKNLGEGIMN
jgi:hypothetical protein